MEVSRQTASDSSDPENEEPQFDLTNLSTTQLSEMIEKVRRENAELEGQVEAAKESQASIVRHCFNNIYQSN